MYNELIAAIYDNNLMKYDNGFLFECLINADDLYHNGDESFLSNEEYDILYRHMKLVAPHHVYFTGVGSNVRGEKVRLPYEMGSLNQIQIGDVESWVQDNNLQSEVLILSDKMDGISALLIYGNDGLPQIAYSRGDGIEGADISRHIFKIKNVPTRVSRSMAIRVEVIMTENNFTAFQRVNTSSTGRVYKNSRNATAGLMNKASIHSDAVYGWLEVIAYELISY